MSVEQCIGWTVQRSWEEQSDNVKGGGEMERRVSMSVVVGLTVLVPALVACGVATTTPEPSELRGGILATFEVVDEEFRVWVTNPHTIQQILDLERGISGANIPNGRILRGSGQADHNLPWSWHLDPEQIVMAEVTVEVCDGAPSFVEEELDYFVETVGQYCPWSAHLVAVQDYR